MPRSLVLLLELNVTDSDGATATIRTTNAHAYTTRPNDDPPAADYWAVWEAGSWECLEEGYDLTEDGLLDLSGDGTCQPSELVFTNHGDLDYLLTEGWGFVGGSAVVRRAWGDPRTLAYGDFEVIFEGTIQGWTPGNEEHRIKVVEKHAEALDADLESRTFEGLSGQVTLRGSGTESEVLETAPSDHLDLNNLTFTWQLRLSCSLSAQRPVVRLRGTDESPYADLFRVSAGYEFRHYPSDLKIFCHDTSLEADPHQPIWLTLSADPTAGGQQGFGLVRFWLGTRLIASVSKPMPTETPPPELFLRIQAAKAEPTSFALAISSFRWFDVALTQDDIVRTVGRPLQAEEWGTRLRLHYEFHDRYGDTVSDLGPGGHHATLGGMSVPSDAWGPSDQGEEPGVLRPVALGRLLNVRPPVADAVFGRYALGDQVVGAFHVRDGGIAKVPTKIWSPLFLSPRHVEHARVWSGGPPEVAVADFLPWPVEGQEIEISNVLPSPLTVASLLYSPYTMAALEIKVPSRTVLMTVGSGVRVAETLPNAGASPEIATSLNPQWLFDEAGSVVEVLAPGAVPTVDLIGDRRVGNGADGAFEVFEDLGAIVGTMLRHYGAKLPSFAGRLAGRVGGIWHTEAIATRDALEPTLRAIRGWIVGTGAGLGLRLYDRDAASGYVLDSLEDLEPIARPEPPAAVRVGHAQNHAVLPESEVFPGAPTYVREFVTRDYRWATWPREAPANAVTADLHTPLYRQDEALELARTAYEMAHGAQLFRATARLDPELEAASGLGQVITLRHRRWLTSPTDVVVVRRRRVFTEELVELDVLVDPARSAGG